MYKEADKLFSAWSEHNSKQLINFIVEYLAEDIYWLNSNISKVDKQTLIQIGKHLENKE